MESRDLGTNFTMLLNEMRRSFDSLRSLRMTDQVDYLEQTNSSFPSGSGRVKTLPYVIRIPYAERIIATGQACSAQKTATPEGGRLKLW